MNAKKTARSLRGQSLSNPGGGAKKTARRLGNSKARRLIARMAASPQVFPERTRETQRAALVLSQTSLRRKRGVLARRKSFVLPRSLPRNQPFEDFSGLAGRANVIACAPGLREVVMRSPRLMKRAKELATHVFFSLETPNISGEEFPFQASPDTHIDFDRFRPDEHRRERIIDALLARGFSLVHRGIFSTSFEGPSKLFQEHLGIKLCLYAASLADATDSTVDRRFWQPTEDTLFLAPLDKPDRIVTIEGVGSVEFSPPTIYSAAARQISSTPPHIPNRYLDALSIRRHLNIPDDGPTGKGIVVAMIDSGFWDHPYFARYRYRPQPTGGCPFPGIDQYGHGTAMAMNFFVVAPDATLLGFQQIRALPDVAFDSALQAGAKIISCSWGVAPHRQLTKLIRYAISQGRIVLFAAGNGHIQWPGNMDEVISVGGVHIDDQDVKHASKIANGYVMAGGRNVPDVCGLAGSEPYGIYILSPTQPGSFLDKTHASLPPPDCDYTDPDDGWVGIGGTSAATAQLAGIVALLFEKAEDKVGKNSMHQQDVLSILRASSCDVFKGVSAQGNPAGPKPSIACGFGFVDAAAALAQV